MNAETVLEIALETILAGAPMTYVKRCSTAGVTHNSCRWMGGLNG